jgi:acyl-coenzyme A synthetase/AMP-(fatty) acid ligase
MKETPFQAEHMNEALARLLVGPRHGARAFVAGGASYAEVWRLAAGLRQRLGRRRPGEPGLCLAVEDKGAVAAALLASLAGGPPLVLPYAFSAQGLAQLQQRCGYTVALVDGERPLPPGVARLHLEEVAGKALLPGECIGANEELLRIFTGGSTGTPQVWSKTAANLFTEGFFLARHFAIASDDVILATIPPYHIYGLLYAVIMVLVAGATVLADSPSFPGEIVDCARRNRATVLAAVPAHYRVLREKSLHLRLAFSSAGMLDPEDATEFARHNPAGIVEVYGSTETGGIATRVRARGEDNFTPFSLVRWKSAEGRLAVASPYLSPELPLDEEGFFTTGDRIAADALGGFALKGRVDAITKVGGKRVDLGEIRRLLKEDPKVSDCFVLALPEASGREHRICAMVEGEGVDCQALLRALGLALEPYALPRLLRKVDKIPMTASGKYDRAAIIALLEGP